MIEENNIAYKPSSNSYWLIGRENKVKEILEDINDEDITVSLITGESGIGKSALLNEIYRKLIDSQKDGQLFGGYYSRKESNIAQSTL